MKCQFHEGRDLFSLVQLYLQCLTLPGTLQRLSQYWMNERMNAFSSLNHFTKPLQLHLPLVPHQTSHLISIRLVPPDPDPHSNLVRACREKTVDLCCSLSPPAHPLSRCWHPCARLFPLSPDQVPSLIFYLALLNCLALPIAFSSQSSVFACSRHSIFLVFWVC